MDTNKMFIPPNAIGIQRTPYPVKQPKILATTTKPSFKEHFKAAIAKPNCELTVSKHAKLRLMQRNIHITQNDWEVIGEKIKEAKQMGVKESLVLLNNAALIVSAKNQTVITAMDRNEASSQIFTNIDGTIIIDS
jgi:flagellar operon protein